MTMASNDGSVPPLSFGPQEWIWFLQHRNVIDDVELTSITDDSPPLREISVLSENGAAVGVVTCRHAFDDEKNEEDSSSIRVAKALAWLHRAEKYDYRALEQALTDMQSQQEVVKERIELQGACYQEAKEDFQKCVDDFGLDVKLETNDISKAVQVAEPSPRQDELQPILTQHADMLSDSLKLYVDVCERTQQPCANVDVIQKALESSNDVDVVELRNQLEELLSFLQSRAHKHPHVPPFMTVVASDDNDSKLQSFIDGLQQALQEIRPIQAKASRNVTTMVKLLEWKQTRVKQARTRLDELKHELQNVTNRIQFLEYDMEWCRDRMESLRLILEKEIASLLHEDRVQVVLSMK